MTTNFGSVLVPPLSADCCVHPAPFVPLLGSALALSASHRIASLVIPPVAIWSSPELLKVIALYVAPSVLTPSDSMVPKDVVPTLS